MKKSNKIWPCLFTILMVFSSAVTAQDEADVKPTQSVQPPSTKSRLRELIKAYEDNPVKADVDRNELLKKVHAIVAKIRERQLQRLPDGEKPSAAWKVQSVASGSKKVTAVLASGDQFSTKTDGTTAGKDSGQPARVQSPNVEEVSVSVKNVASGTTVQQAGQYKRPLVELNKLDLKKRLSLVEEELLHVNEKLFWLYRRIDETAGSDR